MTKRKRRKLSREKKNADYEIFVTQILIRQPMCFVQSRSKKREKSQ